jgi:hypothetical protein
MGENDRIGLSGPSEDGWFRFRPGAVDHSMDRRRRTTIMKRRKQNVEPQEREAAEFVHASRQADLASVLAQYTFRGDIDAETPHAYRSRSVGQSSGENASPPAPSTVPAQ